MIEIVVLSGKGGTGKTSLTGAFAHLSSDRMVCDLDVDAPDLHLLLDPSAVKSEEFRSGHEAVIRADICKNCGECIARCRFDAILPTQPCPSVNPLKCEGCKVCVAFCPVDAVDFPEKLCGHWFVSKTRFGWMVHAQLLPAEENSGRLVALLRQQGRQLAREKGFNMILSDGPPGIGCPVISSLSGASLAVIVTEPTPSGRHDLERIVTLCRHFKVPAGVIINKYDLHEGHAQGIEAFCSQQGLKMLGALPHDPVVTHAMVAKQTVTEYRRNGFSKKLKKVWTNIMAMAKGLGKNGSAWN